MANPLLVEGLSDAVGFVTGALAAFGIGHLLGLDAMAPGYSLSTMGGILLIGLGGGIGLHAARHWRARRGNQADK